MGRLHESDRALCHCAERRPQKPQFADACLLHQQIDECADRPSASRQLRRKRRIARVDDTLAATGKLGRSPQGRVDGFRQWRDGCQLQNTCMDVQYPTLNLEMVNRHFF